MGALPDGAAGEQEAAPGAEQAVLRLRGSCVSKRLEKGNAMDFRAIGITAGLERTFIPPSSTGDRSL